MRCRDARRLEIEAFRGEAGSKASEFPLGGLGLGPVVEQVAFAREVDLHALLDGVWAREVPVAPRNPAAALAFCG